MAFKKKTSVFRSVPYQLKLQCATLLFLPPRKNLDGKCSLTFFLYAFVSPSETGWMNKVMFCAVMSVVAAPR